MSTTPPPPGPTDASASPPPAAPPAAPSTAPSTTAGGPSITPAMVITLVGAVIVVVSIFLNWIDFSAAGDALTGKAADVPVEFLVDKDTGSEDPSIIVLLVPAAVLLLVGAIIAKARVAAILGGILAIVVPVLYAIQVQRGLDEGSGVLQDLGLTDFIGIGVYVGLVGGIVGLVGSLLPRRT